MKRSKSDITFKHLRALALLLLSSLSLSATPDSSKVFGFKEFMQWVENHHPVMSRADILTLQAQNVLLEARGNFDPQIQGDFRQKDYDDKTYYRIGQGGLYIPAWFGADVSVNYRYSEGDQLNPENYVPKPGIVEVGISVPLSPALWMDKRRAALKNAKLFTESADWQQLNLTNQLYLESAMDYWNWALQYQRLNVILQALNIAERQYNLVQRSVAAGDRAAIDTLEASLLLQQVRIDLATAKMEYENARYQLAVHLWLEGNIPLEIGDSLVPEELIIPQDYWELASNDTFLDFHPMVNTLMIDREMHLVNLNLYRAALFPKIKLKYQMLSGVDPIDFNFETGNNNMLNNHALGIGVSIPIFWATDRANLNQTKLKVRDTDLKIALKKAELTSKYKQLKNEAQTFNNQIDLLTINVQGYKTMVEAEETLLAEGESSLFKINVRVNKLLDAELKLADLHFKRQKAFVYWYVISGKGF